MTSRKTNVRSRGQTAARQRAAPPRTYREFVRRFPAFGAAHEQIGQAVDAAGPLDARTCALIKIGICLGAGLESALRSHVRRAREHGASPTELEQAVLLGMNTCGFPRTVAAWQWTREQIKRDSART